MQKTVPSCLDLAMRQKIAMSFLDQRSVENIGHDLMRQNKMIEILDQRHVEHCCWIYID